MSPTNLIFRELDQQSVEDLIRAHREVSPDQELVIDTSRVGPVYPNAAAPFAAAIDYLRSTGREIQEGPTSESVAKVSLFEPFELSNYVRYRTRLTNVVWKYGAADEAAMLANYFVDALSNRTRCENGVIDALNWCLYEVMDNVFQHSRAASGFVMMQLHLNNRRCVISVADSGVGIHRSLVEGLRGHQEGPVARTAHEAIELAVQMGVTSKVTTNQGNGLFGLRRAVELNGGLIAIRSGRGSWSWESDRVYASSDQERLLLEVNDHQATTVDWQLDCSRPVRIEDALGASTKPSAFLEQIEKGVGEYRVDVGELEGALGSRSHGMEVRNLLSNYIAAGAPMIVLDFHDVGVVSSSFADEVLGKLAAEMGELEFRRRIFLDRATPTIRAIVERAIALRLAEPKVEAEPELADI